MPTKMTPERALIVLNQCNTDGRIKVDRAELKEAIKVIHEEMRYRIPRKTAPSIHGSWSRCCPACGQSAILAELRHIYLYCECCGQAIDWSDYE